MMKNAKGAKLRVAGCVLGDNPYPEPLHARCDTEGGRDGSQDRDGDVDDFLPDFFFVHGRSCVSG